MVDNSNETYRDYSPFQTRKNAVLSSYFMSQAVQKAIHKSDTPPKYQVQKRQTTQKSIGINALRLHLEDRPSPSLSNTLKRHYRFYIHVMSCLALNSSSDKLHRPCPEVSPDTNPHKPLLWNPYSALSDQETQSPSHKAPSDPLP